MASATCWPASRPSRRRSPPRDSFDPDRKVPLPFVPRLVGLICANQGDAEHDVVENAQRRWPAVRFEIRRVTVQGARCVPETTAAIRELDAHPDVDVIVVARGGGSLEDLLPFSDETLVRVAAACVTPLVSAIGHEKDSPLLDLVADYRASTPTDAGKRIVPDAAQELAGRRMGAARRMARSVLGLVERVGRELAAVTSRPVLARPSALLGVFADAAIALQERAGRALVGVLQAADAQVRETVASLARSARRRRSSAASRWCRTRPARWCVTRPSLPKTRHCACAWRAANWPHVQ